MHKNGENMTKRKTQNQMDRPNDKGYRNESGKLGTNTRKQEVGEYPAEGNIFKHLWKRFKNDGDVILQVFKNCYELQKCSTFSVVPIQSSFLI